MNDNRNVTRSAKAVRSIKQSAMTHAVRSVLAASALTLALGATSGTATAAAHRVPVAHALQLQQAALDFAPVDDPSLIGGGLGGGIVPAGAPVMSLVSGWGGYFPGGVSASNGGVAFSIYSNVDDAAATYFGSAGNVNITQGAAASSSATTNGVYDATGILADAGNIATIDNAGGAYATALGGGDATGISAYGKYGSTVTNSGGVGAYTFGDGDAVGIEAVSFYGGSTIINSGSVHAYAYGDGDATALYAISIYGDATVDNSGHAHAVTYGAGDATGIEAVSLYGDATVTNSGDALAFAYDTGDATAINAYSKYGNVDVTNSNRVYAYSYDGNATGMNATSVYGDVSVGNSDYTRAYSVWGNAVGVFAYSDQGTSVSVDNSGYVGAYSWAGTGIAIQAVGIDASVDVTNSGDIYAYGYQAAAGINAVSLASDVTVSNAATGTIDVYGYNAAFGVRAMSYTASTTVTNDGSIDARSNYYAEGIHAQAYGDVTVSNSGDVVGYTHDGVYGASHAIGISATSYAGNVTVTNTGHAEGYAWQFGDGIGIYAASYNGNVDVSNGATGDVYAYGWAGNAIGIYAASYNGDVNVSNDGVIDTHSYFFNGIGVYAASDAGNVTIDNSGSARGYTYDGRYGNAVGLWGTSGGGDVTITNDGHAEGNSYFYSTAIGILADAYGNATVDNSATGTVYAYTFAASAIGAYAYGGATATVTNDGYVGAVSAMGMAYGAAAISGGSASVVNNGDVYVDGKYGAVALYAAGADAVVTNAATGYLSATSKYGNAIGAQAYSAGGTATATNAGLINAETTKYGGLAIGLYANAPGGTATAVNSGEIHVSGLYGGAYGVGMAAGIFAYGEDVAVTNTATGSIYARGYGWAAGIEAGGIAYSTVAVDNAGLIQVASIDTAFGIYAYGDNVTVTNSGDLGATPYAAGYYNDAGIVAIDGSATGAYAYGYYNATIANTATGAIDVYGYASAAGAYAHTNLGTATVTNAGSITADSAGAAVGAVAVSDNGNASVVNAGTVDVTAYGTALGAAASAKYGAATVTNGATGAITAYGYTAIGALAVGYDVASVATINNAGSIDASTAGVGTAIGALGVNTYGDVVVNNAATGTIYASGGALAVGVMTDQYTGDATVNNAGAIHAGNSDYAYGVQFSGVYGINTLNNLTSGVIEAYGPDGYAFAVVGDDGTEIINNAGTIYGAVSLNGGDDAFYNTGLWDLRGNSGPTSYTDFGAGEDYLLNQGTINVHESAMSFGAGDDLAINDVGGLIEMRTSLIDMGTGYNLFENYGTIELLGPANVIDGGVNGVVANDGLLDFRTGNPVDGLTIYGTFAGQGDIDIDVSQPYGAYAGYADALYVVGDIAPGTVQTVNVDLDPRFPQTAHISIPFAWVTGNSAAGNFAPGVLYGYNHPLNFIDLGFTIGSAIDATNATNDVFSINLDVNGLNDTGTLAAITAQGAANMINTQVGTFRQRLGVNPYGDAGKVMSAFVRYYTETGDVNPGHHAVNFGQGGHFNYRQSSWGTEVGVNANLWSHLHAGVVLGQGDSRQRLRDGGVGTNRMDGLTFGAYMTWYVPGGWYVDVSARKMAADVFSTSIAGTLQSRTHANAVSLEGGYEFKVGNINIVPQVQYTWTQVDEIDAYHGQLVDFHSGGGNYNRGRIGVDFNTQIESGDVRWTPYGSLNWVHNEHSTGSYDVGNVFYGSTWVNGSAFMAEFGVGVEKGGFGFTIGGNWTDGGTFNSVLGGQASFRYSW